MRLLLTAIILFMLIYILEKFVKGKRDLIYYILLAVICIVVPFAILR